MPTPPGSPETALGSATGASTSVDDVRALVAEHHAHDARERAAKARVLAELDRLARPFDREADPVHVTGSAIVVGPRGTVLHRHRRLGIWLQPGGHVDPDETPAQAALREAVEETGLDVSHPDTGPSLVHLDVHSAPGDHVHLDLRFLLLARDDDPDPAPGESPEVRWFTWEEAEAIADDGLVGALRVVRAQQGGGPRG